MNILIVTKKFRTDLLQRLHRFYPLGTLKFAGQEEGVRVLHSILLVLMGDAQDQVRGGQHQLGLELGELLTIFLGAPAAQSNTFLVVPLFPQYLVTHRTRLRPELNVSFK